MGEPELSDGCGCWLELCLSWQGGPLSRAERCVLAGADALWEGLRLAEPQSWRTKGSQPSRLALLGLLLCSGCQFFACLGVQWGKLLVNKLNHFRQSKPGLCYGRTRILYLPEYRL